MRKPERGGAKSCIVEAGHSWNAVALGRSIAAKRSVPRLLLQVPVRRQTTHGLTVRYPIWASGVRGKLHGAQGHMHLH